MQVAFIYGKQPSSTLTWIFTRSTCYHVGVTDGERFWDMHKTRRVGPWKGRYARENVRLADCPVPVTAEDMDQWVADQSVKYGWKDYIAFAFRWAYHLVGKSTPNYGGETCSEALTALFIRRGWRARALESWSPADLEFVILLGRRDAVRFPQEELDLLRV